MIRRRLARLRERGQERTVGEQHRFEILEHTADAGIVARGATLEEAFEAAAEGMYALMVELDGVGEAETREVTATGSDEEQMLEHWLLELLFLTETEGLVFRRFDVEIGDTSLRGSAHGERLDRERHEILGDVKGVTRHLTQVEREDGGYRVRVLFDM
jgi:SHS2 domain-containing protein